MRELTDVELDAVSGGETDDVITVYGYRIGNGAQSNSGGGVGGGGGGQDNGESQPPDTILPPP